MAIQARQDNNSASIIVKNFPNARRDDDAVIAQDAGRTSGDLLPGTVMAKIAATGKLVPLTSLTATDGTAIPYGIFYPGHDGDSITQAAIVAGDVTDVPVITSGVEIDEDSIVLENSLTLDDIFASSDATNVYYKKTIRDMLAMINIYPRETENISNYENS